MSSRRGMLLLALLLAVGVALRVAALGLEGHSGDVRVTGSWAERMAEVGPWNFYEGSGSIYPALLYVLWPIGVLLDGEALDLAIKGLAIPFDVAIGIALYTLMRPAGVGAALGVAALYVLNPAAILGGPVWGQVDAAGTLPYLLALAAVAAGRHAAAGALAVVATMVKPQFGLVALPVLVVAILRAHRSGTWAPIARTAGGMLTAYVVVAAPLRLDPVRYLGLLGGTATRQPETSLNAFNPWGLFVGFGIPDDPYVGVGTALLAAGLVGSLLGLRRRPDFAVVLAVGAALALAFYFLPTRVHERYLFPAIALLAPFAVVGPIHLAAYVALSLGFAASLVYALLDTTPFSLPQPVAAALTSDAAVWLIGLTLMASAVVWAWLLVVRRPVLPAASRDPPA